MLRQLSFDLIASHPQHALIPAWYSRTLSFWAPLKLHFFPPTYPTAPPWWPGWSAIRLPVQCHFCEMDRLVGGGGGETDQGQGSATQHDGPAPWWSSTISPSPHICGNALLTRDKSAVCPSSFAWTPFVHHLSVLTSLTSVTDRIAT